MKPHNANNSIIITMTKLFDFKYNLPITCTITITSKHVIGAITISCYY